MRLTLTPNESSVSQRVNGTWTPIGSPVSAVTETSTAYIVNVQAWGGHVRVWRGIIGQPQTLLLDLTGVTQSGSSNLVLTVDAASGYMFGGFDVHEYLEAKGTYRYDALGRRIQSQTDAASATTTNYIYDGWQAVEERDASDAVQAQYVYGAGLDEPLNMRRGGQDYFYHADELGNVLALTNSAGQLAEKYAYGPYGQPEFANATGQALPGSALGNPLLFNGREYDPTLHLYNYRMRWLDPRAGRFTTRDPMGAFYDPAALGNPFAYVGNSPWMYTDPYGLWGIQFGDDGFNFGWGEPTLLFTDDSAHDLLEGLEATIDGIVPFADPLSGLYDHCDKSLQTSRALAEFSRDLAIIALTAGQGTTVAAADELAIVGKVGSAGRQTTVLGENMAKRVIPFAEKTGARTLPFGTTAEEWAAMTARQRWKLNDGILRSRIKEGDFFRYIGRDPSRGAAERARFDLTRSELLRLRERGIKFDEVGLLERLWRLGWRR